MEVVEQKHGATSSFRHVVKINPAQSLEVVMANHGAASAFKHVVKLIPAQGSEVVATDHCATSAAFGKSPKDVATDMEFVVEKLATKLSQKVKKTPEIQEKPSQA